MPVINGERYFISQWKPRVLLSVSLGVVKLTLWYPWPFLSLIVGWLGTERAYGLQTYIGLKCDPSKTLDARNRGESGYWMRLDWYECLALRLRIKDGLDVDLPWTNQGGS